MSGQKQLEHKCSPEQVEDERHVLILCRGHPQLAPLREGMRSESDVHDIVPAFIWHSDPNRLLQSLLHDKRLAVSQAIAKFIYCILNVFYSASMYASVPAPYLYSPTLAYTGTVWLTLFGENLKFLFILPFVGLCEMASDCVSALAVLIAWGDARGSNLHNDFSQQAKTEVAVVMSFEML